MRQLKQVIRFASVVAFTTSVSVIPKSPAYASANGCSPELSVDSTCVNVIGKGLQVSEAGGRFVYLSGAKVCNWRYMILFYNIVDKHPHGTPTMSIAGPVNQGCSKSGEFHKNWSPPLKAQQGSVCANFYRRDTPTSKDIYIDRACELITP